MYLLQDTDSTHNPVVDNVLLLVVHNIGVVYDVAVTPIQLASVALVLLYNLIGAALSLYTVDLGAPQQR